MVIRSITVIIDCRLNKYPTMSVNYSQVQLHTGGIKIYGVL